MSDAIVSASTKISFPFNSVPTDRHLAQVPRHATPHFSVSLPNYRSNLFAMHFLFPLFPKIRGHQPLLSQVKRSGGNTRMRGHTMPCVLFALG